MMSHLRLRLRHKLTLITMLTSIVVLVLACGACLGYELLTFQRTMEVFNILLPSSALFCVSVEIR